MIISTSNEPIVAGSYPSINNLNNTSSVSWGAIFAGALTFCAFSLFMFILGTGLGFSIVSPWAAYGVSAASFGLSAIIWITLTNLLASVFGGYMAGRLRPKWLQTHTDEIRFRDAAHGFLVWAIATFLMVTTISSTLETLVKGGASATSTAVSVAGNALSGATGALFQAGSSLSESPEAKKQIQNWINILFQKHPDRLDEKSKAMQINTENLKSVAEVSRIFLNAIYNKRELTEKDREYVVQIVSAQTEVGQDEAQKKVTEVYNSIQETFSKAENGLKEAADKGRKGIAYASLWIAASLLLGAIVASLSAGVGGRHREAF